MAFTNSETDDWEERYAFTGDIGAVCFIFPEIFGRDVFPGDYKRCFDAPDSDWGVCLLSVHDVKNANAALSWWTHEAVLEALQDLDEEDYLKWIEKENAEYLLEQFDNLVAFFKEAAEKGLGAVYGVTPFFLRRLDD
jgi:Domain of unknown function (DUF1877)